MPPSKNTMPAPCRHRTDVDLMKALGGGWEPEQRAAKR